MTSEELPFVDVATIKIATDDFSDSNKLGQGGFGTVYKVMLLTIIVSNGPSINWYLPLIDMHLIFVKTLSGCATRWERSSC